MAISAPNTNRSPHAGNFRCAQSRSFSGLHPSKRQSGTEESRGRIHSSQPSPFARSESRRTPVGGRYRLQPRPQRGVSMSINVCWTIKANKSPDRIGHLSEPSSADTSKVLGKDSKHRGFVQEVKPPYPNDHYLGRLLLRMFSTFPENDRKTCKEFPGSEP